MTVSVTLIQESRLLCSIIDEEKGAVINCFDELRFSNIITLWYKMLTQLIQLSV